MQGHINNPLAIFDVGHIWDTKMPQINSKIEFRSFFEKYNYLKKLRKYPKIHRMVKNIYELWTFSYIH